MDKIIQKRQDLINFFLNEDKEYNKLIILNKEFAVLSFSPHEEYIDSIDTSKYGVSLTDFKCIPQQTSEIYLKGIIADIDNKKDYSILHLQNKEDNISISCGKNVLDKYQNNLEVGMAILVNAHTFDNKVYMHFLIDLLDTKQYHNEIQYILGQSRFFIDSYDMSKSRYNIALVKQATYFTSKKGSKCIRLEVYSTGGKDTTIISCSNKCELMSPQYINATDFVKFIPSSGVFVNNLEKVNKNEL